MLWGRFDNERSTLNMYDNPHFEPGSGLADTDAVVAEAGLSSHERNSPPDCSPKLFARFFRRVWRSS